MDVKDRALWHLDRDYNRPIRDPLWSNIYISDSLFPIIDSYEFQQLSRIKQLGPSHLVYPGATHTRMAHSLGVYHIAFRMIRRLLSHPQCPSLDDVAVRSYLCAALLHDLGHFPFTHSLKELALADHEELAAAAILDGPLRTLLRDTVGADPEMVAAIIDESLPDQGSDELRFFRTLLSGSLDPDKLDYLCRDAYFCGVPYGVQDIDFAISRIIPNGATGIALEQSGISAVENVLFSKYLMYRAVYWHRTVRVATAMIKKGLYEGLTSGLIEPGQLYGLDDETFYASFATRSEPPFRLIQRVHDRRLHAPVSDIPFDETNTIHGELLNLHRRAEAEKRVSEALAGNGFAVEVGDVILDVPESISFEVAFPVWTGAAFIDFPAAGTVFTPGVVRDFTRNLRLIRLMVNPELAGRIAEPDQLLESALDSFR